MNGQRNTDMSGGVSGPARVGAELRGVREQHGWSLADIAARLKIRPAFLQAIESGDLAALPAPAYAAGFIRSYAEALGLDPEEILRRFRAEGMVRPGMAGLAFPEKMPNRGVPPGAVALLVAVIAIGGYVIWYGRTLHDRQGADAVPPVPVKLAPLTVPKQPALPSVSTPAAIPAPKAVAVPLPLPPAAVVPPSHAASDAPPVPHSDAAKSAISATALPPPAPLPPPPPMAMSSTQPESMVIIATARTWVQIRNVGGKILFSRVMEPGESWPLPHEPGLTLTTGNAGGTELIRNGVPGPPLGPPGSVVHNALITPSGTIVPPPQLPARHLRPRRHVRRYQHINPFAVSTRGDE